MYLAHGSLGVRCKSEISLPDRLWVDIGRGDGCITLPGSLLSRAPEPHSQGVLGLGVTVFRGHPMGHGVRVGGAPGGAPLSPFLST